jgi:hypothetical protein
VRDRNGDDNGQATLLAVSVVALAVALMLGAVRLGVRLIDLERASAAADAAALAALDGGRSAAADMAARNGARLTGFTALGDDVAVVVVVGDATGEARATRAP